MATYTLAANVFAAHAKSLAASTEDTVVFAWSASAVEVINPGTSPIYFTVNGSPATVAGGTCHVVLPGSQVQVSVNGGAATKVRLISLASTTYHVTGV